jgi:hypothetical protein
VRTAIFIASVAIAVADERGLAPGLVLLRMEYRILQLKRLEMMSQQWFFDWDNAHVHTDTLVSSWFDAHGVQRLEQAPYSPNIALTDFV